MIRGERIKLDIFQDSLVKGDMLIDSDNNLYKFIQFGYCKWVDSCKQCKGKMELKSQANGFKDYRCFSVSSSGQYWSNLWHIDVKWLDDKDFEI